MAKEGLHMHVLIYLDGYTKSVIIFEFRIKCDRIVVTSRGLYRLAIYDN